MHIRYVPITICILLFGLQSNLYADGISFRCGGNLISLGDTMYEIRGSCRDPYSSQVIGERNTFKILKNKKLRIETIAYVTEWIYESNNGIYLLTFVGSRLEKKEYIYQ